MKKIFKVLSLSLAGLSLLVVLILFSVFVYVKRNIDYSSDEELFLASRDFESTVFYANASNFDEYVPIAIENTGNFRKTYTPLSELPQILKEGFIAVEDRKFYEHSGVDVKRTLLAAVNYLLKRDKIFGASTITQQVVKNVSGDNERSLSRKFSEILRARHIEKCFEKDEILEVYLNVIPMSEGAFGIAEAAKGYFGKEPCELSAAECATLIGITNAPTAYNPYINPDRCLKKRNSVLQTLYSEGVIDREEYDKSVKEEIKLIDREERCDRYDSWFTETVIESVSKDLAEKKGISPDAARFLLSSGGYRVYTTMNMQVQRILEEYFENANNFPEEIDRGLNYAFTVLDSENAKLLGIIGRVGKKSGNRLLNHALVPHTPASTLKPIALYAPLINEGVINWATVLDDVPLEFYETEDGYNPYPRNSPDVYDGLLSVKDSLRLSKNTAAIRLCTLRGAKAVFKTLKEHYGFKTLVQKEERMGKTYTDIANSPMALGQLTDGVSLLKLTESYTVFPSDGRLTEARCYLYVEDHKGNTVLENKEKSKSVMKETTARIMNQLLSCVVESGTAKSVKLKNIIDTAGKTGTSGNNKDKLFVGYTPYYTAGIWCGYDSGNSIGHLSKGHLQIWDEVMTRIHNATVNGEPKEFSLEGLLKRAYCKDSGKLYSEKCLYDPRADRMEYGYFTADNMPSEPCDVHVLVKYDGREKGIDLGYCPREDLVYVALIKADRKFPLELTVTDAEFVYKDLNNYSSIPSEDLPYFYYSQDGGYSGLSDRKKHFNRACPKHR